MNRYYYMAIKDFINFVEENLREEITFNDMLNSIPYSQRQFYKILDNICGISIGEYIRKRRLTEAAIELRDTKKKIIDIASEYQYETPEGFTRAFKNEFRISPSKYRKYNITIKLFYPINTNSVKFYAMINNLKNKGDMEKYEAYYDCLRIYSNKVLTIYSSHYQFPKLYCSKLSTKAENFFTNFLLGEICKSESPKLIFKLKELSQKIPLCKEELEDIFRELINQRFQVREPSYSTLDFKFVSSIFTSFKVKQALYSDDLLFELTILREFWQSCREFTNIS